MWQKNAGVLEAEDSVAEERRCFRGSRQCGRRTQAFQRLKTVWQKNAGVLEAEDSVAEERRRFRGSR